MDEPTNQQRCLLVSMAATVRMQHDGAASESLGFRAKDDCPFEAFHDCSVFLS